MFIDLTMDQCQKISEAYNNSIDGKYKVFRLPIDDSQVVEHDKQKKHNTVQFKLLKDLPDLKAGAIFKSDDFDGKSGVFYTWSCKILSNGIGGSEILIKYGYAQILRNPDWFELVVAKSNREKWFEILDQVGIPNAKAFSIEFDQAGIDANDAYATLFGDKK